MRKYANLWVSMLAASSVLASVYALPALSQERPESILPPGFGDPEPAPTPKPQTQPSTSEPRPSGSGTSSGGGSTSASVSRPKPQSRPSGSSVTRVSNGSASKPFETLTGEEDPNEEIPIPVIVDIPPQSRRPIDVIGSIAPGEGEMGLTAFQNVNGAWLSPIMRRIKAPIASRWASIFLRRALLSHVATPADVNGADWAADRASLLVRMGESQAARSLVQAVDVDQYTPRMFDVGLDVALAAADPAMTCGMTDYVKLGDKDINVDKARHTQWLMVKAMCAGLGGESGVANANLDKARDKLGDTSIDVLLAEKVVGAGSSTKRSIGIEWEGVKSIDAWRFGLASATGVSVPDQLYGTAGPQFRAWQAQAPLLPLAQRLPAAERSAELGVFSNAMMVDLHSASYSITDPAQRAGKPFEQLRIAYSAKDAVARLTAMHTLWKVNDAGLPSFAGLITTARAAAALPVGDYAKDDAGKIIASMLTAGFDPLADKWSAVIGEAPSNPGWGLLAVASQKTKPGISAAMIDEYGRSNANNSELRAKFLFAGLAGLGRLPNDQIADMAKRFEVQIGVENRWNKALRLAANADSPGSVAVLAAVGLQASNWKDVPAEHLYHIVRAVRQSGYAAEARMIAAEALMRI